MFKKLFGGKKADEPVHQASAATGNAFINSIQGLVDQEETLEKRKQITEKRMEAELEKARDFNRLGKKAQALQCLKRKKLYETELTNLDNQIMKIIEQRQQVESQRTTVATVSAMSSANKATREAMKVSQSPLFTGLACKSLLSPHYLRASRTVCATRA